MISVITIIDTHSGTLTDLYQSLTVQTCQDFEWILVNASPKDTFMKESIWSAGATSQKIRVVSQGMQKGQTAAKNAAIGHAKGEFIFFIDADGSIAPMALEKALLAFESNPHFDFVNSYVKGVGEQVYSWRGGFHDGKLFLFENRNTKCFMARRRVFEKVLFNENLKNGYEDWDFWLHAASLGLWGYTVPEFLFYYRRQSNTGWLLDSPKLSRGIEKPGASLRNKYKRSLNQASFPSRQLSGYTFGPISTGPPKINVSLNVPGNNTTLLFIIPWLEIGGADKFNLDLALGLKRKGWSITIACTVRAENEWLEEFEKITDDIFFVPHYSGESGYHKIIEHLILSRHISMVFLSNSMYGYYLLPFIRQRFPSLPVTDYIHCEETEWYNGGYPMLSTIYSKSIARTFVTSHYLKNWCAQKGKEEGKMEVAYIDIDTASVKRDHQMRLSVRKKLGIDNDTSVILYVARLTAQKQPDVLLKTIDKLYSFNKNFFCIIIGNGPERDYLVRTINKSMASRNMLYLGALPNEEVKNYMDASDIFFLPSAYEGIALSIFEAMSKGLAIVGANVGGQEELVTKECGTLVQRSTPEIESDAYCKILKDYIEDPSALRRKGDAGRARVETSFDISLMTEQMDLSLKEVIKDYSPGGGGTETEYIVLLNRLMMLSSENKELAHSLNNSLRGFISRRTRHFKLAKNIYHKFNLLRNK